MNRERGRGACKTLAQRRVSARDYRRDRGVPIVGVQNVGMNNFGCGRRGGFAEEGEAAQVVGKIAALIAVHAVACEELCMIDQIDRHAVRIHGAQHAERMLLGAKVHGHRGTDRFRLELRGDGPVTGDDNGGFRTRILECGRQSTDNVGKSADFRPRRNFCCYDRDLHYLISKTSDRIARQTIIGKSGRAKRSPWPDQDDPHRRGSGACFTRRVWIGLGAQPGKHFT